MYQLAVVIGFTVISIAVLAVPFLAYYWPTRIVIAKAGLPPMALKYYLQAFAAMLLANVIAGILMSAAFDKWPF